MSATLKDDLAELREVNREIGYLRAIVDLRRGAAELSGIRASCFSTCAAYLSLRMDAQVFA